MLICSTFVSSRIMYFGVYLSKPNVHLIYLACSDSDFSLSSHPQISTPYMKILFSKMVLNFSFVFLSALSQASFLILSSPAALFFLSLVSALSIFSFVIMNLSLLHPVSFVPRYWSLLSLFLLLPVAS